MDWFVTPRERLSEWRLRRILHGGDTALGYDQKPSRPVRDGEVGVGVGLSGSGIVHTYSLHCHHQIDSALRWAPVSHFDVSLIVWVRSQ